MSKAMIPMMKAVVVLIGAIFAAALAWNEGAGKGLVWSPARTFIFLEHLRATPDWSERRRFRILVPWLENDYFGEMQEIVVQELATISGLDILQIHEGITALGAGDQWRESIRMQAKGLLETWDADLLIIGTVQIANEAVILRFIPQVGEDGLLETDAQYILDTATLPKTFKDRLRFQIVALAFNAITEAAEQPNLSEQEKRSLAFITIQIDNLLNAHSVQDQQWRLELNLSLGARLLQMGRTSLDTNHLENAATAYRRAIAETQPTRPNSDWASSLGSTWVRAQNGLGNALSAIGERTRDVRRLRTALEHYDAATSEGRSSMMPVEWAQTMTNRGNALVRLGALIGNMNYIREGLARYDDALEIYSKEMYPTIWSKVEEARGNAYIHLASRSGIKEDFEQALESYQKVQELQDREATPSAWARIQNNMGYGLMSRGACLNDQKDLDLAARLLGQALEVRTRKATPAQWLTTKSNLARTRLISGSRNGSQKQLKAGIEDLKEIVQELEGQSLNEEVNFIHGTLGLGLLNLGIVAQSREHLTEAFEAYKKSINLLDPVNEPSSWYQAAAGHAIVLAYIARHDESATDVANAIKNMDELLEQIDRQKFPIAWTELTAAIGRGHSWLGDMVGDRTHWTFANTAFRAALEQAPFACTGLNADAIRADLAVVQKAMQRNARPF